MKLFIVYRSIWHNIFFMKLDQRRKLTSGLWNTVICETPNIESDKSHFFKYREFGESKVLVLGTRSNMRSKCGTNLFYSAAGQLHKGADEIRCLVIRSVSICLQYSTVLFSCSKLHSKQCPCSPTSWRTKMEKCE